MILLTVKSVYFSNLQPLVDSNLLLIASKGILFQSSQSLGAGLHWFGGLAPGWTSKHLARSYDVLL